MRRYRIETDALGTARVPADRYHGIETQRALETPVVTGLSLPRRFHWALGLVKRSFCEANEALELLDVARAEWIATAAQEVMDGRLDADFPLDVFQSGNGATTDSNANEVIANRAIELMGGDLGSKDPIHPRDHVGLNQPALQVVTVAAQVACAGAIEQDLVPALRALQDALDESPSPSRDLFEAAQRGRGLAETARDCLLGLALTAPALAESSSLMGALAQDAAERIADEAELPFRAAAVSPFAHGPVGALASASRSLAELAEALLLVARGEQEGAVGTSAEPSGSPNEALHDAHTLLATACGQVLGNNVAIHLGDPSATPSRTAALPLLAFNLLQSISLLSSACLRATVAQTQPAR